LYTGHIDGADVGYGKGTGGHIGGIKPDRYSGLALSVGQQPVAASIQVPSSSHIFAVGNYTVQCQASSPTPAGSSMFFW